MNNKATNLHVYSEAGGLLVGNIATLEEARDVATAYAEKNVGKMANIFTVLESHICRVSPLEIIPANK